MSVYQNRTLHEEVCFINSLISTSDNSEDFIRDLILSGYTTEKKIIQLFIRTSLTVHALEVKLLKGGFDITCSTITIGKDNEILVFLPSRNKNISVFANSRLRA